jgi:hypothetical protein
MLISAVSERYDVRMMISPSGVLDMAKAKAGAKKRPATASEMRHARIELTDQDYERLKRVAKANGLGVAGYVRQAVLKQVRRDEDEIEGSK